MTDRAYRLRAISGASWSVEGQRPTVDDVSESFACRLVPDGAPEREADGGQVVVSRTATLVVGPDAELRPSDRVLVQSALLGDGTYRVTGEPRPAATRRRVVARLVPLEAVVETGG